MGKDQASGQHGVLGVIGSGRVLVDEVGHPPVALDDLRARHAFRGSPERVTHRLADQRSIDARERCPHGCS